MNSFLKRTVVFSITTTFVFNSGLGQILSYAETSELYKNAKSIISSFDMKNIAQPNYNVATTSNLSTNSDSLTFGDFKYTEENGSVTITRYTGSNTTMVIPSEIDGKKVVAIGNKAFQNCRYLTKITIPDTVTNIGQGAFLECESLTEVTLSSNLKCLESKLFYKCSKLSKVNIPPKISYIGEYAFYSCDALAIQIDIPDTVTSIGSGAFQFCSKLPSVTMSDNVTSIGDRAFYDCNSLKSLNLSNGITTIEDYTFYKCAFSKIDIPDGVTTIGVMAFGQCSNLTYFNIPNKVESIGEYAFVGTDGAKVDHITLTITLPKSLKSIGDCAFSLHNIVSITVEDGNPYYSSINGVLFSKDLSTLVMFPEGKKDNVIQDDLTTVDYVVPDNVTTIGRYAFSSARIKTIILPDGLKKIEEGAFSYSRLSSIAIPHTVTNIGKSAFDSCIFLAKLSLPNQITTIEDYTFSNCHDLNEIIIPNNVTTIGKHAFYFRKSSTLKIVIPNSVTYIDKDAFFFPDINSNYHMYGYTGSYAETYAKQHSINFESIEEGYYGTYLEFEQSKYTKNINSNSKIYLNFKSDKIIPSDITYQVGDKNILSIEKTECTNKIVDKYNTSIILSLKIGENTGTTTITATTSDGKTATCTVTVEDPDKVKPPDEYEDKDPIIILPGIMGSRLFSDSTIFDEDTLVWDPEPTLDGIAFLSNKLLKDVYVKPPEDQQSLSELDKDDKFWAFSKYKREYGSLYTYKNLIDSLCNSTDRPVYIFSYNWMKGCSYNATELRKFINTLEADKVDIVAHSMGGLVASSYYTQYKDDNKVDRIITCATPYEGAPCIINKVQNWDILTDKVDVKNKKFWEDNALGFLGGLNKSTKSSIISTSEVIPTKNYISKTPMMKKRLDGSCDLLSYEEYANVCKGIFSNLYSPAVQFQDSILSSGGYNNLLDYENAYFLIGTNQPTITSIEFKLIGNDINKKWYEDDLGYDMKGDGTVPYLSGSMIEKVKDLYTYRHKFLDVTHNGTVKNKECIDWIKQKLEITTTGSSRLSNEQTESKAPQGSKFIVLRVACPVDVDVELNGEALNSSASECTSETSFGRMDIIGQNDEIKMFCLDESKDYKITLDGTDEGTMDYAIRYFNEDGELEEERSIEDVEVTANTIITTGSDKSKDTVLKIDNDGDGVVDEEKIVSSNKDKNVSNITFDPNNGDSVLEKTIGKEDVLDYIPENPIKDGYTFVGWFKDVNDTTTEYKPGTTHKEDVTYTAKWIYICRMV